MRDYLSSSVCWITWQWGVGAPESRLIPGGTNADVCSQVRHFAELSLQLRSYLEQLKIWLIIGIVWT